MQSTVDPILYQAAQYVDLCVRKRLPAVVRHSKEDRVIASLYALRKGGFAQTARINDFDREYWYPTDAVYGFMYLEQTDIRWSRFRHALAPKLLCVITEAEGWSFEHQQLLTDYFEASSTVPLESTWITLGSIVACIAKKWLVLTTSEIDGGLLFTITKKGQRAGFSVEGRPGADCLHFSLTESAAKTELEYYDNGPLMSYPYGIAPGQ
jgi:hypothetical protein